MPMPNTVAGVIGRFREPGAELRSVSTHRGERVLDLDPEQKTLDGDTTPLSGRAATYVSDTEPRVAVSGTNVSIGREEVTKPVGTEFSVRGQTVYATATVEEGGGTFPFTLLSAVGGVRCERLNFDTDAVKRAWEADGTLSDTWLAGSKDSDSGTVMAYGEASQTAENADIGLGFERAWEGYMLRGVVYASGYVGIFEDLPDGSFLRFVEETLLPHGYVPDDNGSDGRQPSLDEVAG